MRRLVIAIVLIGVAWLAPHARHRWIQAILTYDAQPSEAVVLPPARGGSLPPSPHVRVILIDGLAASAAQELPNWRAVCNRGAQLVVDVGFPTVSLPVEAEYWSGLTQQQSGIVFRSDTPLEPPLVGIPSQVAGSWAVAEDHGWIVGSLGFARTDADHGDVDAWHREWIQHARDAVASDARLAFVHILRVDTAGHKAGRDSALYTVAAGSADALLGELLARGPDDARWFILSDHGHMPEGGHGGEERDLRQVEGCIAGPDVPHVRGGPVHAVDISRAIADAVGVKLSPEARGRPFYAALRAPLISDQAVPPTPLGRGAGAIFILLAGAALSYLVSRTWWLGPWWFGLGVIGFIVVHGEPSLSTAAMWAPTGRAMYVTWIPALVLLAVTAYLGSKQAPVRAAGSLLLLPIGAVAAAMTASRAWPLVFGLEFAPVVPHVTAWLSPLILITAQGCGVVGLALLARSVRSVFDRPSRPDSSRT
ncbi:MAG: alkaline phosphatase family protein [Kofleriaceae bacterium]